MASTPRIPIPIPDAPQHTGTANTSFPPASPPMVTTPTNGTFTYDQAAADSLKSLFDSYGLSTLAPTIVKMVQSGMSDSAIVAQLRQTPEYKARFPGMDALRKQGYNAIDESQYLQLEDGYHQALQSAGLPPGFYDNPQDFVKFMANGVDPNEVKQRAQAAADLANQIDPTKRDLLSSMYGVSHGDIAAYFLDPNRAMPLLQKQQDVLHFASEAKAGGVRADYTDSQPFEKLVDTGITDYQARNGFQQISAEQKPMDQLSAIWGGNWSFQDEMNSTFYGNGDAMQKKQRLVNQEKAAFSGASGFNPNVSGQRNTAGSF